MAVVKVENKTYTVDPLYQWDKNQALEIRGLSLAKVPEVHFTNTFMDRAIVRPASMNAAGVITTQVPNSLLQKAGTITVYLCEYEGNTFRTLYKLEIPVKERKRPGDYTFEDDAGEVYSFNALETAVTNALTAAAEAKNAYNTATQKETTAAQDLAACKALLEQATAMLASAEERYNNALDTLNGVEDGSVFLKKVGDEMAGSINMNGHAITGLADPNADTDAATKGFVADLIAGSVGAYGESAEHPGCFFRTVGDEIEWLNPPMVVYKSYRTAERVAGQPVYVMYAKHVRKSAFSFGDGATLEIPVDFDQTGVPFKVDAFIQTADSANVTDQVIHVQPLPYHAAGGKTLVVSDVANDSGDCKVTLYGENITLEYNRPMWFVFYYTKEAIR